MPNQLFAQHIDIVDQLNNIYFIYLIYLIFKKGLIWVAWGGSRGGSGLTHLAIVSGRVVDIPPAW
jgi:hypothetical protein